MMRVYRCIGLISMFAVACGSDGSPDPVADDPADAVFVTRDIGNFWTAYDAGGRLGDADAFQREYLDRASSGLRDFIRARDLTPTSLTQMVQAFPDYFADIRPNTLRLVEETTHAERIRTNYEAMESLYPAAVFPPVTFLIGRFSTGGTVGRSGMLIGTEFFAIDGDTPLDELGGFQRANVRPLDQLTTIVAHEHVHVLQAAAGALGGSNATLLEQVLHEGIADFLGELVSGGHLNDVAHAYGLDHEAELWLEFTAEMDGTDVSRWLYNQGTATGARPGDLGYFVGYRIAQAYYEGATDPATAVREIIAQRDASGFLAASGYDPS